MSGRDPMEFGWWLASRASGIVALILIALSVALGLAMAARAIKKPGLPRILLAIHEHAALAEALAKAAILAGPNAGRAILSRHGGLLITNDGAVLSADPSPTVEGLTPNGVEGLTPNMEGQTLNVVEADA